MRLFGITLIAVTLLLSNCSTAPEQKAETKAPAGPPATFVSDPDLKDVMAAMIEMDAETIWNIGLDENAPKTDEDWKKYEHAAIGLVQTSKLLMTSHLAKDQGKWKEESQKLVDTASVIRKAVNEKNRDAVIEAGNKMNDDCSSCHKLYFNPTQ
jgi:PBP1b-binding outer membrane lipoprotein LpoB